MTAPAAPAAAAALTVPAAVASYRDLVAQTRQAVLDALTSRWQSLKSYRDADMESFVRDMVPMVRGGQQHTATLTSAYLAQLYGSLTGGSRVPLGISSRRLTGAPLRGGAPPEQVYQRPFQQVWYELSQGKPLDAAVEAGGQRLQVIAATDLQLSSTHAAKAAMDSMPHVTGYRRVLTGAENCGMCVVASTQRYHKADLLPIHPRCDCVVAPIVGDEDPGQVINSAMLTTGAMPTAQNKHGVGVYSGEHTIDLGDLLEPVHAAIRAEFGKASRDARSAIDYRHVITVHHHGEIGPVLTVKGQHFATV